MIIEKINGPEDLKGLTAGERQRLSVEMRAALLERASVHGGHFGPVFGAVEAIIALHTVFDSPRDKIVFDVSHQCYAHKMLTGRKEAYLSPAHYDDVSGYTNPSESRHDLFNVGHTSTSISLALGLAKARDLTGGTENVVAFIGDGSLSGGEALEGLDFAGDMHTNFIIIVNDNDMAIAENHGGMYRTFKKLRDTNGQAPDNLFKAMGLDYRFVGNGNDTEALIAAFREVKDIDHPVVVHIVTQKGKGYRPAEEHREAWHSHPPFDIATGQTKPAYNHPNPYAELSARYFLKKIKENPRLTVICSANPSVLGFTPERRQEAGRRFIDVGIAEETAVALASGMAKGGARPVYGVYSSFLQRTYDQLSQDLCLNDNPAVIVVGMASVRGMNDATHLGIFDIPLLAPIPGLIYLAPAGEEEYLAMLDWAIAQTDHPVAIRMPVGVGKSGHPVRKDYGGPVKYEVLQRGKDVALLGLGNFLFLAEETAALLEKDGIHATVVDPLYITGTDQDTLEALKKDHHLVVTLEDGILSGGWGERIAAYYGASDMKVMTYGLAKKFYDRYDPEEVLSENRLTPRQLAEDITSALGK